MKILIVTGGICSGKSYICNEFNKLGIPFISSDDLNNSCLADIEVQRVISDTIPLFAKYYNDRPSLFFKEVLRSFIREHPAFLSNIESITYPLIKAKRVAMIGEFARKGLEIIILEIPLFFEKDIQIDHDYILLAYAPLDIRIERYISRNIKNRNLANNQDNLTILINEFNILKDKQLPDEIKKLKADFIINTALDSIAFNSQIMDIYNKMLRI